MNDKLKKTGKIALIVVTPAIIVLIFFISVWMYKRYKKKPSEKTEETDKDVLKIETEEIINK
jgi:flagellar basal body-associated protein FliL